MNDSITNNKVPVIVVVDEDAQLIHIYGERYKSIPLSMAYLAEAYFDEAYFVTSVEPITSSNFVDCLVDKLGIESCDEAYLLASGKSYVRIPELNISLAGGIPKKVDSIFNCLSKSKTLVQMIRSGQISVISQEESINIRKTSIVNNPRDVSIDHISIKGSGESGSAQNFIDNLNEDIEVNDDIVGDQKIETETDQILRMLGK